MLDLIFYYFFINQIVTMSEFYKVIKSLDLFELFEKIQDNIFFIIDLRKFDLETPLCIQNEQNILNFYLTEKWLDDFPKQSLIFKFIEEEKKLFYLPESADFYYHYYHLLIACKNYLKTGKKIYDYETQINYYKVNDELIGKKLNATKFFEIYLEKGSNFTDEDFFLAKKGKDELNEEFNFNGSEMTSEPVREEPNEMISELTEFSPVKKTKSDEFLTLAEEFEVKINKEENSQVEIEVEEVNSQIETEIEEVNSQVEIEVEELNLDNEVHFTSFV